MGEARRRGSFQQRKAVAIKRDEAVREAKKREKIAKMQAMTPEEIEMKKRQERKAAQLLATVYGIGGTPFPYQI